MHPLAGPLLAWYHQNRRILPFREESTPYRVWVSEIMLQQTRVSTALPYFERFVAQLPSPAALAACGEDELHKLWQGLGYYNRARNMQKAAKLLVENYRGELPENYTALLGLPGIGEYTAGAIASIAFGLPEVAVDGNVLRVFSRLLGSREDISLPQTKKRLSAVVRAQQPPDAPGDFNQAIMELGALVCTPGTPGCNQCPLTALCEGYRLGIAAELPVIAPPKPKLETHLCLLVLRHPDGRVLLHRRPTKGLLASLYEPLAFEGRLTREDAEQRTNTFFPGTILAGSLPDAKHVFTHRIWQMYGWAGLLPSVCPLPPSGDYYLATPKQLLEEYAVPGAFKTFLPLMACPNVDFCR